jgi:hypothetical protein
VTENLNKCRVCAHSDRAKLETSVARAGQRKTAKVFGISRQAIQRHYDPVHLEEIGGLIRTDAAPTEDATPFADPPVDPPSPDDHEPDEELQADTRPHASRKRRKKRQRSRKERHERKAEPKRPKAETLMAAARLCEDYIARKRLISKLLRTGSFDGMPTLERLKRAWPELSMLQLAELVAQAAIESDFLRGTRQARRLVILAKADRIYRTALERKDLKTALRALEFTVRVDGISAEPDLIAALASSQAWTITARVLQSRFPEAFDAIHGELVAEEARKRQALAPATLESSSDAE